MHANVLFFALLLKKTVFRSVSIPDKDEYATIIPIYAQRRECPDYRSVKPSVRTNFPPFLLKIAVELLPL